MAPPPGSLVSRWKLCTVSNWPRKQMGDLFMYTVLVFGVSVEIHVSIFSRDQLHFSPCLISYLHLLCTCTGRISSSTCLGWINCMMTARHTLTSLVDESPTMAKITFSNHQKYGPHLNPKYVVAITKTLTGLRIAFWILYKLMMLGEYCQPIVFIWIELLHIYCLLARNNALTHPYL